MNNEKNAHQKAWEAAYDPTTTTENLKTNEQTAAELVQMLANATYTSATARARTKIERNRHMADRHRQQLTVRGLPVPGDAELMARAVFNGPGCAPNTEVTGRTTAMQTPPTP